MSTGVHRGNPPPVEKEITLYAEDSPTRPGNTPQPGESDWTLKFPLHDGSRLHLHVGKATWEIFVAMLAAYAADEADEQLRTAHDELRAEGRPRDEQSDR